MLVCALLGFWLAPQAVQAQDASRYTFALRGTTLDDALRKLITTTRMDLSVNPSLIDGKRVYCVIEDAAAEDALRCLLKGTGLDYYRLSSGLYVLIETPEAPPQRGTLQGIIVDGATGEPLPYAHVLLADGSTGAVSNESGRFLIANLNPGYYHVTTSYIGYRQRIDSVWVPPQGTGHARLPLHAEALPVTPIVVDGLQWRQPSEGLGADTLWLDEYNLAQYPGGSPDVSQGLGTLTGIRLNDATADVHVQGGETGEHQFRLDGAPVFVPISIGGLVGPFSPFAIGRVTVQKTGFGAEVGSQGAGVIQLDHNLGDARLFDVQADPLSVNARLGLQFGKPHATQTTLMLAGRYGLWQVLGSPSFRDLLEDWNRPDPFMLAAFNSEGDPTGTFRRTLSDGNPGIGFYDLHAAARVRFGPLRSLYASTYLGHRELDSERNIFEAFAQAAADPTTAPPTRDLYGWTNSTSQARFEAVLGSRVLASLRGRASLFRLGHDYIVSNLENNDFEMPVRLNPLSDNDNRIQEFAVEARFDVAATDFWSLETGVEPTHTFSRFLVQGTQPVPISHRSSLWRVGSFLTNRFTLSRRLSSEIGTRLTYVDARETFYAEPRLAVRYDQPGGLLGPWSARIATGLYRQFVNQFDVSSRSARALLATSRTWLAVDESVRPPLSTHLAGEMLFQPGAGWTLRLEGYYKRHLHLLAINYSATRSDIREEDLQSNDLDGLPSLDQSLFLTDGEGYTYGSAVQLEKRWHRLSTEIRYERSEAQRTFGLFFTGNSVPAPWNEPHRLEWAFDWQPTRGLTLLGRWRGIWGRTWGFRQSYYDYLGAYPEYIPDRAPTRALFGDEEVEVQVDIAPQLREFGLNHPEQHRLPPVYQLDLSVAYTQRFGSLMLQTRLDLLNVLDRDNVADWRFAYNPDSFEETGLLEREDRLLLPFTPSLAVRMAW